jgi:hypothetical protein
MKKLIAIVFAVSLIAPSPAQATRCADGTYSSSTGRGTCSKHGGIASNSNAIQAAAIKANLERQKKIAEIAKAKAKLDAAVQAKADAQARSEGYKNAAHKQNEEKIAEQKRLAAEKLAKAQLDAELEIARIKAETEAEIKRIEDARILAEKVEAERIAAQAKLQAAIYADIMAKEQKRLNPNNPRQWMMQTNNFVICNEFGGTYTSRTGQNCHGFIVCEQLLINAGYATLTGSNTTTQMQQWINAGRLVQTPDNPMCSNIKGK